MPVADGARALLAALSEPALLLALDGRIEAANRAAASLFATLELPGRPFRELSSAPDTIDTAVAMWARSGQPMPATAAMQTNRGEVACRFEGVRVSGAAASPCLLVRAVDRPGRVRAFTELSEQLADLNREVDGRIRAEQRLERQLGLLELIARGASLSASLEAIALFVEAESDGGAVASILLVEDDTLRHGAAPSLPAAYNEAIDGVPIGPAVGSCGTAAYRAESVVVEDIANDPLWADFSALALEFGLRACWSTPVLSAKGEVLGTVAHYYQEPRLPTADDTRLSQTAGHVGIAIERHRVEASLRERASELAESNLRKNEFLAMLGHELRNPLSPMVTTLELLRRGQGSPEQTDQWLAILQRQLSLMRRLVDNLLDISRVTRGKVELRPRTLDLREVVHTLGALHRTDERLHISTPEAPVWAHVDAERMQQVVGNLVHNAFKFTPDTGRINLELTSEGREALLRVRDNGRGIDPAELPQMFELFAQGTRKLDRSEGGLGIGLTLVRSLVTAHRGRLSAHSDGLGKGVEFLIRLPLVRPEDDRPEPADEAREAAPTEVERALEILIVDDDVDGAMLLADLLRDWGHGVRVAHDGASALASVEGQVPDLVVLDIGLPVLNGFQVAERLRGALGIAPERCQIAALTGYGRATDQARARAAGCDHFLVKPVELDDLERLLAQCNPTESQ